MMNINPKDFGTTYAEMNNFSSTFAANCKSDYFGWRLRRGFVLKTLSPRHYFETYNELGRLVRTKLPGYPVPKRII